MTEITESHRAPRPIAPSAMSAWRYAVAFGVLLLGLLLAPASLAAALRGHSDPARQEPAAFEFMPGDFRELRLGESGEWTSTAHLDTGEYLELMIDQLGTDVVIAVRGPDSSVVEADSPTGGFGIETISVFARIEGAYSIEVRKLSEVRTQSAFKLRVSARRVATGGDTTRAEAQQLYTEALQGLRKLESAPDASLMQHVEELLLQAANRWTDSGATAQAATSLVQMSAVYLRSQQPAEASHVLERAYSITKAIYGPGDPRRLSILNGLADSARQAKDFKKAREYFDLLVPEVERVYGPTDLATAVTLLSYGTVLEALGESKTAIAPLERAVIACEAAFGPMHPALFDALLALGNAYEGEEDERAIDQFRRAAAIAVGLDGPSGARTAQTNYRLGRVIIDLGDTKEAAEPLAKSLAAMEKSLKPEHPAFGLVWQALGEVAQELGKLDEAVDYYAKALKRFEETSAETSVDVVEARMHLATAHLERADYEIAQTLFERTVDAYSAAGLENAPDAAIAMQRLGTVYARRGNSLRAIESYGRALNAAEESVGNESPLVALILMDLARLYRDLGQYAKAEPLCSRSLTIYEKAFGPEDLTTANTLNNLAELYRSQGQFARAEPLYMRALAIYDKVVGPEHSFTATGLTNLAGLFDDQGQYAKSEQYYVKALGVLEKLLGPEHPDTAITLGNLALLYLHQGRFATAEPLLVRALSINEKALGADSQATATSLNNLARLLSEQGQYARAEPLQVRALAITEKALGPEHPETATLLANLAALYNNQGYYSKAEPFFMRALAISEKSLGPEHPSTAICLARIIHEGEKHKGPWCV